MFWVAFGLPLVATGFEWVVLGTRRRDQLRHITVIVAMAFCTASALLGIWGLMHIGQLRLRHWNDYGFETAGWLLAALSVLTTLPWVAIERKNWLAWLALAISAWMFVIWMLIGSSL